LSARGTHHNPKKRDRETEKERERKRETRARRSPAESLDGCVSRFLGGGAVAADGMLKQVCPPTRFLLITLKPRVA